MPKEHIKKRGIIQHLTYQFGLASFGVCILLSAVTLTGEINAFKASHKKLVDTIAVESVCRNQMGGLIDARYLKPPVGKIKAQPAVYIPVPGSTHSIVRKN